MRRRLAAAGRSEQDEELLVADVEQQRIDRDDIAELLGDVVEPHAGHRTP